MSNRYDIMIIGAGISGLSLAHYCKNEGLKTLIIEKSNRIGGSIYSYNFRDIEYWIELGAHTCYNSYVNLIKILEETSSINKIIKREKVPFKMLVNGGIRSIPSQLNFCELFMSAPKVFSLKKEDMSVREYYSKIVGIRNFENVISPALNAVISQDADDFPADLLFKRRTRRKDIIKKFSFKNGLQTIADSVSSQEGIDIVLGKSVNSLIHKGNYFEIISEAGSYESEYVAIATSALSANDILRDSFPFISERLSRIHTREVESVGVVVEGQRVSSIPSVAGIIPRSDLFYSIVSRDTVKDPKYRGFTFHFKPDVASRDLKIKRITDVLGIKKEDIGHLVETKNLVPALKKGHRSLINDIDNYIFEKPILLTGNYFDGLAIEDCIIRSLKEFLRLKRML